MSLYAIEKREPGGEWEIHTYAPSADLKKIADGLPACAKNTDKEWRVSTFARVEPGPYVVQHNACRGEWTYCARFPSREEASGCAAELAARPGKTVGFRVVEDFGARAVVETFASKGGV